MAETTTRPEAPVRAEAAVGRAAAARPQRRRSEPASVAPGRTVIEPPAAWPLPDLRELWRYRDMLVMLTTRDIAARYRQSVLGIGWAVVRPLVSMAIFTVIFGRVAGLDEKTGGVPYPLFAFAALIPWMYFATCLTEASASVVANGDMLSKVYFPRLVLPLSKIGAATVDFLIQAVVLAALMAIYRTAPTVNAIYLPVFLVLAVASAFAAGLWLTALNVRYRDIGHALPFLTQVVMYLSPIIYPASLIPERWQPLYFLNPMAGVIEGSRWALFGTPAPDPGLVGLSAAVTGVLLVSGLFFFARTEQTFADII
jgi:lipopolysaccharide transport system permease protein